MPDPYEALKNLYSTFSEGDVLDTLRGKLNKRPSNGVTVGDDLPQVPPAPPFRPYPQVVGSPYLAKVVDGLLKVAPELQGQFKSIGYAPTMGALDEIRQAHIPEQRFADTNLQGTADRVGGATRQVYINPHLDQPSREDELQDTVGHELTHIAGEREPGARETEALLNRFRQFHPLPTRTP